MTRADRTILAISICVAGLVAVLLLAHGSAV